MNKNYENGILTVRVEENYEIDSMSLGMLANNEIEGIAKISFSRIDDIKIFKYEIGDYKPLSELFNGIVDLSLFISVLRSLSDTVILSSNYLVDENSFLFDLENIYFEKNGKKIKLICLPLINYSEGVKNLSETIKRVLFGSQFDYGDCNVYFGKLVNYLNSNEDFSIEGLKKTLEEIPKAQAQSFTINSSAKSQKEEMVSAYHEQVASNSRPVETSRPTENARPIEPSKPVGTLEATPEQMRYIEDALTSEESNQTENAIVEKKKLGFFSKKDSVENKKDKKEKRNNSKQKSAVEPSFAIPGANVSIKDTVESRTTSANVQQPQMSTVAKAAMPIKTVAGNFGETSVLGAGSLGETTLLDNCSMGAPMFPYIIRTKTGERVEVNKPVFRIGKERSYVDYFVADNAAVSRSHANIKSENGKYFIEDTNSTNHTFVNGRMIPVNTDKELCNGDHFRLGNEEFEFYLV